MHDPAESARRLGSAAKSQQWVLYGATPLKRPPLLHQIDWLIDWLIYWYIRVHDPAESARRLGSAAKPQQWVVPFLKESFTPPRVLSRTCHTYSMRYFWCWRADSGAIAVNGNIGYDTINHVCLLYNICLRKCAHSSFWLAERWITWFKDDYFSIKSVDIIVTW